MIHADLIVYNARIYTVNTFFDMAEAFAVKDGKFIAVGAADDILKSFTTSKKINAEGKTILPGLIDPHCHLFWYGYGKLQADLRQTKSPQEAVKRLKKHYNKKSPDWILGKGWNHELWPGQQFPDKTLLDTFFDIPVYLERIDTHAAWVNSKALEIAGITADTEIAGGKVLIKNEEPSGILIDQAMELVKQHIPPFSIWEKEQALMLAQEDCFSFGLTSIGDAYLHKNEVDMMIDLQKENKLKLRVYAMLVPNEINKSHFFEHGIYQDEMMNIRSFKFFSDGTLGSRSAFLFDDYADDPGNKGIFILNEENFNDTAAKAVEKGFQINTHCIGDRATHEMLKLYINHIKGENNKRWRIEHAQLVQPEDLELFSKYSVIPSIQTTHAISDMPWIESRIGANRMTNAYPYQRLLQQSGLVANGSDFPVEAVNPLSGFYTAVARKDSAGNPSDGFLKHDALTRKQALKAMTIWAAFANFEEHLKGHIKKGTLADFVILDKDIMKIPEQELPSVQVLQCFIGGQKVK